MANGAFDRVVTRVSLSASLSGLLRERNIRCTIATTPFTALHIASQLFHSCSFDNNVFPSLVQGFLHFFWYIDHLRNRDYLVPAVDKTIKALIEPESVSFFAIFVQIFDLATMQHLAFTAQRGQRANVGVHRGINESRVVAKAQHIARPVDPVDAQSFDGRCNVVRLLVTEFHDSAEIVGITRRLANEINVIWKQS